MKSKLQALSITLLALGGFILPVVAQAESSGNIGLYSKYILRGYTPAKAPGVVSENDSTAVQGGLDYESKMGLYAGYWASNLGYGDEANTGFENDLYAGYAGDFGLFGISVGLIQYVYINIDNANALEFDLSGSIGPVTARMQYMTNDVVWGNTGDIYWSLASDVDLPKNFSLSGTLGFYSYDDSEGKYIPASDTTITSGFRHLDLSLSHPIGKTGADFLLTYVVGGKDRADNDLRDGMILGINFGFGL